MRNIKQYIIPVAVASGCIFLISEFYKKSGEFEALKRNKRFEDDQVHTEAREISRKVDSNGMATVIFDINSNKASPNQLSQSEKSKKFIDSAASALDLRTKQLRQIMVLKTSLEAENLWLKKQLDSSNLAYYTYTGNGIKLKFIPPNAVDTTGHANLTANVQLKTTQFWRRNWVLGPKKEFIAITSDNPMFRINNVSYLEIEQKRPAIQFRIQANSSYDLRSGIIAFGPATLVEIGRLSFKGFYGKSLNDQRWNMQVNASFDLLSF
jgi:hypothetical protein